MLSRSQIIVVLIFIQVLAFSDKLKAEDVALQKLRDVCVGQIAAKKCSQRRRKVTTFDIPTLMSRRSDDDELFSENSIFFIDTSCDGNFGLIQACTVSAAALLNPNYSVNILLFGNANKKSINHSYLGETVQLLSNVFLYKINLQSYFKNTPLEKLMIQIRNCLIQVYPQILSYVTLNLFGGVYLDWNILVTKPFELLPQTTNFIAKVDKNILGTGILALSKRGKLGRNISEAIIRKYSDAFLSGDWEINSTKIITEVFRQFCGCSVKQMSAAVCKEGYEKFEIYNPNYFYPIRRKNLKTFYLASQEEISDEPFGYYIWNSDSVERPIYKETLLGKLVEAYCPYNHKIQRELMTLFNTPNQFE